ncbi:uncharacterized protein LOC130900271 [Diorhabda carinulata]|uniref:uncharacterized protein LOC130900271 n=1 Tax=Diorhabda carinulata TaxID=1163345 RepID=UPI0025A0BC41|nr:uncharacterized protein LOC130900271 [Diorhabda carinulata]
MCFRFRKQPGYCAIRLYMNDFQLQSSYECQKDYVLLENQHRYCGRSLLRQYITFDLTSKNYEDLRFVTGLFFCGRGFCGSYEQLPCQQPTVPINLTTTTIPPSPTPNVIGCDRYISDQSFTLEMNQNKANCIFEIKKFTKSACKVDFHFEKFDLFCGSESLLMNNITLCGHLTDRKISVNFDEYYGIVTVVYRSNLLNKYSDFKFKITGQQVTDDCLIDLELPQSQIVLRMSQIDFHDVIKFKIKVVSQGTKKLPRLRDPVVVTTPHIKFQHRPVFLKQVL